MVPPQPPNRPGHRDKYEIITPEIDKFMMDFENHCLEFHWHWDITNWIWPQGNKRHEDPDWAAMIKKQIYPHNDSIDWEEYCNWVSRGYGGEWFQEDQSGSETPPPPPISCTGGTI